MTNIQIDIDEGQNNIVNMCKLVNGNKNKQEAISQIILDWGRLQYLSDDEIYNKVLEYFKKRWGKGQTHDKRDWIKDSEKKLRSAYKEYSDHIKDFPNVMAKKYKVTKRFVEEFLEEENWTDDEDEMDETSKSDKKIKVKIFDEFQESISASQKEISEKYSCEIEHEEYCWSAKQKFGLLTIEYSGGKESNFYLNMYVREVVKEMTRILRGNKSLRKVIDENKSYLDKMEREANSK